MITTITVVVATITPVDVDYWTDVYEHTREPIVRLAAASALNYRFDPNGIEVAIAHLECSAEWHAHEGLPSFYVEQHRDAAAHLATYASRRVTS